MDAGHRRKREGGGRTEGEVRMRGQLIRHFVFLANRKEKKRNSDD